MGVDTAPPTPLIYARRLGLSVMRYGLGWFAHTRTQCFSPGRYRLTFPKIRKTTGIYIFVELPPWSKYPCWGTHASCGPPQRGNVAAVWVIPHPVPQGFHMAASHSHLPCPLPCWLGYWKKLLHNDYLFRPSSSSTPTSFTFIKIRMQIFQKWI